MQVAVATNAQMKENNRWDPKYFCLLDEHRPLIDELCAKFAQQELADLVKRLPFDQRAADAVVPRVRPVDFTQFVEWAEAKGDRSKKRWLAVYVAAAAQFARNRRLEQLVELQRKQIGHLQALEALLATAKEKHASHLLAAITRDIG